MLVKIDNNNNILFPNNEELEIFASIIQHSFRIDDNNVVKLNPIEETLDVILQNSKDFRVFELRKILILIPDNLALMLIYCKQMLEYYIRNQFCGSCGNKTRLNSENKFLTCPKCQHEIYPHIAPCVMVRIDKNDQILLARGINFVPNSWGLIAGFVEVGETLEEALIREVKEEVGITITDIKYFGSQSWPLPQSSLIVGFTALYHDGNITIDHNELESAGFFPLNQLPGMPSSQFSIAYKMIEEALIQNRLPL